METPKLYDTILKIEKELDLGCSEQRSRYLEQELNLLLEYQSAHPDCEYTPTQFQLFCFQYPDSLECKIFDV